MGLPAGVVGVVRERLALFRAAQGVGLRLFWRRNQDLPSAPRCLLDTKLC